MAEGGDGVREDAREVLIDVSSIISEIDLFVSCNNCVYWKRTMNSIDALVKS